MIDRIRYNDIQHNDNETNNDNQLIMIINQDKNNDSNSNKDNNYDEIMTKKNKLNC